MTPVGAITREPPDGRLRALWQGDVMHALRRSKVTSIAAIVMVAMLAAALFAPVVAPHDPFDLASLDLGNALLPPAWWEGGRATFGLGTDDRTIYPIDENGVTIAALQALYHRVERLEASNESLREENRALRRRVDSVQHH